ncbi:MAG: hypothetical protein GY832_22615 [Chloroflexi bacterium]|nr:hypothetical protein [Chloroflexota bacterium]
MSDREFYGKEEEKEHEKEEEKSRGGFGYEKWRRDPLSAVVWAGILMWAGVVLLAGNLGFLANLGIRESYVDAWPIIFIGSAVIVFLEALVRLVVPAYRRAVGGTLFFAAFLLAVGLGNMVGWSVVGPLLLIAFGLSVLARGFFRDG